MSILNVDQISPIGSGSTITVTATETKTGDITIGTGTSIFSPAGNTLVLGTNNLERIRIKNDGSVGIGEDSPDSLLHIGNGTNADDGAVTITIGGSSVNTRQSTITKNNVGSGDRALEIRAATGGSDETIKFFSDATTERLRIGSSGQIGIGGANYGTSGQVLTSQGSGSAVQWATPSSGGMTLLHTMNINMTANTQSQSLNLTGYVKLMGLITGVSRSGGVNDTWLTFNGMNSSGNYSWVRTYLDNSNDTSTNRSGTALGYAYGSVGPGFFINLAGIAAADSGNIDAEFTVHNLQESGRKIFTMTSRSYLVRYMVIDTRGSINTTSAITSFAINVSNAVSRNTGGTIKFYGVK